MKTISTLFLIFGLISYALAQYGIPDDDDEPAPVISSPLRSYSYLPATQPQPTLREEPLYSAPKSYAPQIQSPIRIEIQKENNVAYQQPQVVRSEPLSYSQPERILIREENLPSYNAPAPAQSAVRFQDDSYSYNSQPVRKEVIPIVKYVMSNDNYGSFSLETVSGDGTTHLKSGHLKNLGDEEGPVQVMSGSYSFTSDDGKLYKVDWTADENGFRASGDHLPTTPAPQH